MSKSNQNFTILVTFYCLSLVIANIVAGKLITVTDSITLTAAIILFPVVYIIGDIIPEIYGLKTARKVIFIAFGFNLLTVLFFYLVLTLPFPSYWENQSSFEIVLGFTPRLLTASFSAYLIGSNLNAWIMVTLKKLTKDKYLWFRTISSTVVGEAVDSLIFITLAFGGILPNKVIFELIFYQSIFKIGYEVLATPVTYWVINSIKKTTDENSLN